MRFCPFCAHENSDESPRCSHCGKRLPALRRSGPAFRLPGEPTIAGGLPAVAAVDEPTSPDHDDDAAYLDPADGPTGRRPADPPPRMAPAPASGPPIYEPPIAPLLRPSPTPEDEARQALATVAARPRRLASLDPEDPALLAALEPTPAPVRMLLDLKPDLPAEPVDESATVPMPLFDSEELHAPPPGPEPPPLASRGLRPADFEIETPLPTPLPAPPQPLSTFENIPLDRPPAPSAPTPLPPASSQSGPAPTASATAPAAVLAPLASEPALPPLPAAPDRPGRVGAVLYLPQVARAVWARRKAQGAIRGALAVDQRAIDQALGELGRAARAARLDLPPLRDEMTALIAAEERRAAAEAETTSARERRNAEGDRLTRAETACDQAVSEQEQVVSGLEAARRRSTDGTAAPAPPPDDPDLRSAREDLSRRRRALATAISERQQSVEQLEARVKRATHERSRAAAEIASRHITLGTLLNLHRDQHAPGAPLYARLDQLKGSLARREAHLARLDAELRGFDHAAVQRGLVTVAAAFGGLVLLTLLLILIAR